MLDWDNALKEPVEAYDQVKEFINDPNNKFLLKQLGKGLALTCAVSAGKFIYEQYKCHSLIRQGDGRLALLKNDNS